MEPGAAIGQESDLFTAKDVLVSRTDKRGVILAANEVFQRVSEYPWETLANAPHKIVRHPDMPKGIFWLLWRSLNNGIPIAAFVKNRTQTGKHYWAFAFVSPIGDGFTSLRIKPSAKVVQTMSAEYATFLRNEKEQGLTPEQSGQAILARLRELGYASYEGFMAAMASDQMLARNETLNRPPDSLITDMHRLSALWAEVRSECANIVDAHIEIEHTPTNLRVQAVHLNEHGVPMSVIASNFESLATVISENMNQVADSALAVESQLEKSQYLVNMERLTEEVVKIFEAAYGNLPGIDRAAEIEIMKALERDYSIQATAGLGSVRKVVREFASTTQKAGSVLSGLAVIKIMSEIENAYLDAFGDKSIAATIGELQAFQNRAHNGLSSLRKSLMSIRRLLDRVERSTSERAGWPAPNRGVLEATHRTSELNPTA